MNLALLALLLARRDEVDGLVLATDPARLAVTVSHKEVPGLMPAMAMPFRVRDAALLEGLRPGMFIRFELSTGEEGGSYISRIRRIAVNNEIEEDGRAIALQPPKETVAPGQPVPDFELTDQLGRRVKLSDSRGKVVAVNFLYTRCPLPEVCPRLAATFARIQRRFSRNMGRDLALLTITLDPVYDTPGVLNRYAALWRAAPASWRFLTGTLDEIRRATAFFGIVYWPEEGVITHTSSVAIIGRDGRLHSTVEGLNFNAQQLGDLIETAISYKP